MCQVARPGGCPGSGPETNRLHKVPAAAPPLLGGESPHRFAWLLKKKIRLQNFLLQSYLHKLCAYLNSLGLQLFCNYEMETDLHLNYKESCKASEIKNINIAISTMLFFRHLIVVHSMIMNRLSRAFCLSLGET